MAQQEYQPFEIDMDLEQVQAWDGEQRPPLPVGRYKFEVVGVRQTDAGQIEVKFQVLEGEQAGTLAWNNYNFSNEVGLKRLKHFMVQIGASLGRVNSDEFMGAQIYADIVHNQGKSRPGPDGAPLEPKTFANIINERNAAAEEAELAGSQAAPAADERPPITRSTTQAQAPAPAPATTPATSTPPAAGGTRKSGARRA